jgi:phospholipase C
MARHTLRTLAALAALVGLAMTTPANLRRDDWRSKIKNVVVLVEENRSFDTFCGGLNYNRNNLPHYLLNFWSATNRLAASIDGVLNINYCNAL